MSAETGKRVTDQGFAAVAAQTAKVTSRTFWGWVSHHHVDSLAVLSVTLWLSIRVIEWALDFSYAYVEGTSGAERAGIIAAILTPWGLSQSAMVKWYMDLKAKSNGNAKGASSL